MIPLDSTLQAAPAPKGKVNKPKAKATAGTSTPKAKGVAKPKVKNTAKSKAKSAAKSKSVAKKRTAESEAEPMEEAVSPPDVNGDDDEDDDEGPPKKKPAASSSSLMKKPAAGTVQPERSSKISNPYFYSNLNQWGIKIDGKQKISVWPSVICCFQMRH